MTGIGINRPWLGGAVDQDSGQGGLDGILAQRVVRTGRDAGNYLLAIQSHLFLDRRGHSPGWILGLVDDFEPAGGSLPDKLVGLGWGAQGNSGGV